jgi:hypothetical protein
MRASYQADNYSNVEPMDAEDRLRQLVRLRGQRGRVLTAADEDRLLEEAVTRLGVSLERAQGILLAETSHRQIALETGLEETASQLIEAIAGKRKKLSYENFEAIAHFYATQRKISIDSSRQMIKRLMEEEDISPAGTGLLMSTRWYRRIREKKTNSDS